MWQHKSFPENHNDSDHSISDEEEEEEQLDFAFPENVVSLAGTLDRKKENMGVAQFELLKGVYQDTCFSSEDEVESPDFHNPSNLSDGNNVEGVSTSLNRNDYPPGPDARPLSVKEGSKMPCKSLVVGDNASEKLSHLTRGKEKQSESCTSSAFAKKTIGIDQWTDIGNWATHQPFYFKDKILSDGSRRRTNPRSSSHVKPHRKGTFCSTVQKNKDDNLDSSDELLDDVEAIGYCSKDKNDCVKEPLDVTSKSRLPLPIGAGLQRDDCRSSMVELLDHLVGRNSKLHIEWKEGAQKTEKTRLQNAVHRRISLGKDLMSDEDSAELLNSGSSTENEDVAQISRPVIVESKRKTMADKFQETFGCAPVQEIRSSFLMPKQRSSGLFGRLQQVMQRQREQDSEFLKKLQIQVWPKDEARCIDVKILSRLFDAKLTVCHCSLLENEESSIQNPHQESFGKTWTIIFNSRVCGDVDLEVGNMIRIHPPWKEVQVLRCGEIIILTTYFSQI